jgi:uncharacterized protein
LQILFEINHPAHVHLFRNMSSILKEKGIDVLWLLKNEPVIAQLAEHYGIKGIVVGKKGAGKWSKWLRQVLFLVQTTFIAYKNKSRIGMGVSMTLPLVSKWSPMRSICLDDDDMSVTPTFAKYANKASAILTPGALSFEERSNNHLSYPGYHELAYLHPNRFKPDPAVLQKYGLKLSEVFFILRFNAFKAHHDKGHSGISTQQRRVLTGLLEKHGKVFVSTEDPNHGSAHGLPGKIDPWDIHSLMYYATLFIGDSQTMTSEAAVLGTPALKCNTFAGRLSIPNELEHKYSLCFSFLPQDFDKMLEKINSLLATPDLKNVWQRRRQKMLSEKIDVTAFLVWFIENYPDSVRIMKEDPDYQWRFK